jgi:ribosomal protein L37AE/L43A
MTAAVLDRPSSPLGDGPARPGRPAFGGGVTLEARLDAALHAARMEGSTKCPVCHSRMTHTRAGAREAAECGCCGAVLT